MMRADRVTERFSRYLNGPMGKTVLENLDEGESFILQTSEHTFRITKVNGRAIIDGQLPSFRSLPNAAITWSYILETLDTYENEGIQLHLDLLYALGFGYLGYIEADISEILKRVSDNTKIEVGRKEILPLLLEQVFAQIETKGQTTGLHLDEAMKQHTEFVVLAPTILDLRKKEMAKVRVPFVGDEANLRYLWLTAYGFQILSALKMRLYTNQEGLLKIRESLQGLGYNLRTTTAR